MIQFQYFVLVLVYFRTRKPIFKQNFPVIECMRHFVTHDESDRSEIEIIGPVDVEENVLENSARKLDRVRDEIIKSIDR